MVLVLSAVGLNSRNFIFTRHLLLVEKNPTAIENTAMLSTANATWARLLSHNRMLGRFVAAATIGQVRYASQCAKKRDV